MGTGDQLRTYQGILAVERFRVYLFQGITAQIVVTVPGRCSEMDIADSGLLHRL